jgi:tetratricopeptide (TPR) repeat protein
MGWGALVLAGAALVAVADIRWFLRWNADAARLAAEGRYTDLPVHHQGLRRSWRPTVWLLRKMVLAGQLEAQEALHLHQAAEDERALEVLDGAVGNVPPDSPLGATYLAIRVLALAALVRLEEAEACAQKLLALPQAPGGLLVSAAQVSLIRGRLDECLQRAFLAQARDPQDESAHILASLALMSQGKTREALAQTEYRVRSAAELLNPKDVAIQQDDEQGRQLLAAQEQERAQVTRPSPLVQAANCHLDVEDAAAALTYLERARPVLGKNAVVGANFHFILATALAIQGKTQEAQGALEEAHKDVLRMPRQTGLQLEMGIARARVALHAGQVAEGLAALDRVQHLPQSPLMAHHLRFWRARLLDRRADPLAKAAWSAVLADGVEDVLTQRARQALGPAA